MWLGGVEGSKILERDGVSLSGRVGIDREVSGSQPREEVTGGCGLWG